MAAAGDDASDSDSGHGTGAGGGVGTVVRFVLDEPAFEDYLTVQLPRKGIPAAKRHFRRIYDLSPSAPFDLESLAIRDPLFALQIILDRKPSYARDVETIDNLVKVIPEDGRESAFLAGTLHGNAYLVRKMLELGVDPNCRDSAGVVNAVKNGNLETFRTIFEKGGRLPDLAEVWGEDWKEESLLFAAEHEAAEICQFFIDQGATFPEPDNDNRTPLNFAIKNKDFRTTTVILDAIDTDPSNLNCILYIHHEYLPVYYESPLPIMFLYIDKFLDLTLEHDQEHLVGDMLRAFIFILHAQGRDLDERKLFSKYRRQFEENQ
jgi:hypothetical protein